MKYGFIFLCLGSIQAQEDLGPLVPERPGFTASSGVVGLGVLQLEQGYTFETARMHGWHFKTLSAPQMLVHFGFSDDFELRFGTNGYSWQELRLAETLGSARGLSDYIVSGKLRLMRQGARQPEVSVMAGISFPARGSDFTTSGIDPLLSFALSKDLPRGFSVTTNLNVAAITDDSGRLLSTAKSVSISHRVKGSASAFGELFRTTIGRTEGSQTAVSAGMYWLLGKHVQVDIAGGHTVAGLRPAWFATAGFVIRDPHRLLHHVSPRE